MPEIPPIPAHHSLRDHHAAADKQTRILKLIAVFKLAKGVLLLTLGLGALHMMHRDLEELARKILLYVRADPESERLQALLAKISGISPRKLGWFGVGAFTYAILYFTEGIGLLMTRRWAEWLAVVTTAGFIPLEVYEVVHHPHVVRILVLIVNVAILIYLIWELRRKNALLVGPDAPKPF